MMQPMTLTVPAGKEWVLVLRMAAAGVGALYNLPVDELDDLATAIEESCDLLLHQDYQVQCLTLTCEEKKDSLHVALSAAKGCIQPSAQPADADMARLIIGTLVRQVDLEQDENGVHTVRMILPAKV